MKIVIAVHHFPPRYTSGAERYAQRMAVQLQLRGHDVRVVCVERIDAGPAGGVAWEDQRFDGIPVRRLEFNLANAPDPFQWEYNNPWIGQHLARFLDEQHPDVFHLVSGYLMTGSALQAAYQAGIPTVVTLTDYWFICPRMSLLRSNGQLSTLPIRAAACARCLGEEKRRYRLPGRVLPGLMDTFWRLQSARIHALEERRVFLRRMLNQADMIISPSQFLRSVFIEAGVEPERIAFSRHGMDCSDLTTGQLEKAPSASLRVGYLGQIAWLKGVHVLFEAARLVPSAHLTVAAYGNTATFPEYTARLRRIMAGDERLTLAGVYHSQQELDQLLRGIDVVVVPSLWYENCPTVILEALAHRTPVITSDLGGMAELIKDGENGLLVAPNDAHHLARQLQRLLDDSQLLSSLREHISPVRSIAHELDQLEEIYRRVSGKNGLTDPGSPSVERTQGAICD